MLQYGQLNSIMILKISKLNSWSYACLRISVYTISTNQVTYHVPLNKWNDSLQCQGVVWTLKLVLHLLRETIRGEVNMKKNLNFKMTDFVALLNCFTEILIFCFTSVLFCFVLFLFVVAVLGTSYFFKSLMIKTPSYLEMSLGTYFREIFEAFFWFLFLWF